MQFGNACSVARPDAQRRPAAVKEMTKTRGGLISNSQSRISVGGIIGTQKRLHLRESGCVLARFIWPFGIGWTTYSSLLIGLR